MLAIRQFISSSIRSMSSLTSPLSTTWRELDMNTSTRKRLRDKVATADAAEERQVDSMAAAIVTDPTMANQSTARSFWFPDEHTNGLMIEGLKYEELPVVHLKATKNNTLVTLTDHRGIIICQRSAVSLKKKIFV